MRNLEKSVPVIRFKGFSEAWEQRKLGEDVNFLNGRAYSQKELLDKGKYKVLRVGNFNTNDRWYYSDLELEENKYANRGDLLYLWATNFGPEIWNQEKVIYHYHIWKLKIMNINVSKQYLYTWLITDKERIKQSTNGTTMVHVTKSHIEQREFQIPPNLTEQQKIGDFFKQLDDTIALHQRKLDALKLMKKGFLQQMFPKSEEDVPKIRFTDFDGKWRQRKLGDVFNERSERSADGELISVTINSGVIKASKLEKKDNSSFDKSNYKVVKKGDIAYNSMRMWQGASGCSFYDGILSPAYTVIYPRKDINALFIAYMFKKIDMLQTFQRNSQGLTSDTWNLKFPSLSVIKIKIPTNEEQIKITNLFRKLEYTSTLHQNQIDRLKKVKKAYLKTMFI
ncbi:TPA: restriction endonuclease subunit S [Listeria innocua]|uniref:restriction endonuclease subunit S n=1 Tax=Listeria innocua TaxID=1642 RepID=UPI0010D53E33|nr:restriction endonuclease subunit S [Listeria innocua]EAH4448409.1 restriction endonuclease subunit S [Listeria innocua]EKQ5085911.1 restriction endonuclease subunit S [Listeria innocua]MBC2153270.1 restriction endonuclease subunit S [Listeria innocua]HBM3623191.1 restriction endonuclease subunit S [Listeria innocua]HCQ5083554.1 restriction endonuclease subunit S [Listeria innocua]